MNQLQQQMRFLGIFVLIIGLGFITVGCDNDSGTPAPTLTLEDIIDSGWDKFEEGDWEGAFIDFQSVIQSNSELSDAWNGAGWSAGRIAGRSLDDIANYFDMALQSDTTQYDAMGGSAFTFHLQGEWQSAIDEAKALLNRRPGWRFLHEQSLNSDDLYLMMAAAYYNLGGDANVAASYDAVHELNPTFETDITTPTGRRELLNEIERLRRIYG